MGYTTVHEAFKLLKNLGLIQLVKKTVSDKKVEKHIYRLNLEGLLWLFAKHAFLPKSRFPDTKFSQLKGLKKYEDVNIHILYFLDIDRIARKNENIWPEIFPYWQEFKQTGIADDIAWTLQKVALQTLMAYYNAGFRPTRKFKSLNELLTWLVIDELIRQYVRVEHILMMRRHSSNETLKMLSSTIKAAPHLKHLFKEAIKEITKFDKEKRIFIRKLRWQLRVIPLDRSRK